MRTPSHDAVAAAIRRFNDTTGATSGEQPNKLEAINALEDHLAAQEARGFVLKVLQDPNEYDLARVEVCRALLVHNAPSAKAAAECAKGLLKVLRTPDDTLVRQWAAKALANFVDIDDVSSTLVSTACDPEEDADVRHNTVASLHRASLPPAEADRLRDVIDDPEVGLAIRRYLEERKP